MVRIAGVQVQAIHRCEGYRKVRLPKRRVKGAAPYAAGQTSTTGWHRCHTRFAFVDLLPQEIQRDWNNTGTRKETRICTTFCINVLDMAERVGFAPLLAAENKGLRGRVLPQDPPKPLENRVGDTY